MFRLYGPLEDPGCVRSRLRPVGGRIRSAWGISRHLSRTSSVREPWNAETRAVNHMVRQAVPYTNEPENRSRQHWQVGTWAVLLQLAVVLVSGSPRKVVMMLSRGCGVKKGHQICVRLSGHAAAA